MEREQVLVFPANAFDDEVYSTFAKDGGIIKSPTSVWEISNTILNNNKLMFMDRASAETNPLYKQVIPYCLLVRQDGYNFAYQRTKKGGESRLHDLWSIGVGGHINPADGDYNHTSYWNGLFRELEEEVGIVKDDIISCPVNYLLYDSSNEVGKVHFGLVHTVLLNDAAVVKMDDCTLSNGRFEQFSQSKADTSRTFENWSRILLDNI